MGRFRGPKSDKPADDNWAILNHRLFGANDAGGYDIVPSAEVCPVDWTAEFGREAPLALEIGFNRGKFLDAIAAQWEGHAFIGIEVRRKFVWHLAQQIGADPDVTAAEDRGNVRVIWADAKNVVNAIFAPGSLDAIFINFPDPWWKRRHVKRRLVDTHFAQDMADLLRPGGRIFVKSDVAAIAAEIGAALESVPELSAPHPFDEAYLPFTHRETRCVAQQMPISRNWYERRTTADR